MTEYAHAEALAARIRGLIAGQDRGVIEATARRLGVSEVALRMTIDDLAPVPAVEVVAAIVREYGVDPTWLMTGEYDASTHRLAIDNDHAHQKAAIKAREAFFESASSEVNRVSFS